MTTGAVIFAHNNGSIDYVKLANFAASRVKKYLDIPVCLITDSREWLENQYPNHVFDTVIDLYSKDTPSQKKFFDGSLWASVLAWKNSTRSKIYDLSPYDTTLVLDSDYILNSNLLKLALERNHNFQIYKNSFDLSPGRENYYERLNQYSIPFYWATVFIFKKTEETEAFFTLVEYIKNNWLYFRILYNINVPMYRNDFAFSIAIHLMNGKTDGEFAVELPGKMNFASDRDLLMNADDNKMNFLVEKKDYLGEYYAAKTKGLDVHVMNKWSLSRFIDGGTGV